MEKTEGNLIAWIASRRPARRADVSIGIGDDMAMVEAPAGGLLVTSDMLMDGAHFDTSVHSPQQIGRKALAVNLSDCAAMAVQPLYAVVSVALPNSWTMAQAQGLFLGMEALARRHDCALVGGDTNSWPRDCGLHVADGGLRPAPLVIDLAVLATPWEGVVPVRRDGMRAGDLVCVTGALGGSSCVASPGQAGPSPHHLSFEPRVDEARVLAEQMGKGLHAMIDLSDGLSTDGHRLAAASACGIEFDAAALEAVAAAAAVQASREDGRSPLQHVLDDGEDYELLFAVDPGAAEKVAVPCAWARVGTAVAEQGVWLRHAEGHRTAVKAGGWEHFVEG